MWVAHCRDGVAYLMAWTPFPAALLQVLELRRPTGLPAKEHVDLGAFLPASACVSSSESSPALLLDVGSFCGR